MKTTLATLGIGLLVAVSLPAITPVAATADPLSVVNCATDGPEDPHLSTVSRRQGLAEVKAGT
ncbi:hypothetical protein, partial [Jatrophihabitans sp.]|uniref:hypothetical protein n=1 Tax=Jatrophihabitans sp. TaxID=1932789 RepID=UPI002F077D9C